MSPLLIEARYDFYDRAETTREYIAYARLHGIDPLKVAGFAGATAILPVIDCGHGRFDWDGQGERFPAFVCEAYDWDGETTIDIVAWPLDRPRHVMSMFGTAPIMGLWEALNPSTFYMGKALTMHRSPLDWIKAGCTGAAIVKPKLAAYLFLDIFGPIAAQDRQHARELVAIARSIVDEKQFVIPVVNSSRAA